MATAGGGGGAQQLEPVAAFDLRTARTHLAPLFFAAAFVVLGAGFLDREQQGTVVELLSQGDQHFGDRAVERGGDVVLHLHRLEHHQHLAGLDLVAHCGSQVDHHTGHGRDQTAGRRGRSTQARGDTAKDP